MIKKSLRLLTGINRPVVYPQHDPLRRPLCFWYDGLGKSFGVPPGECDDSSEYSSGLPLTHFAEKSLHYWVPIMFMLASVLILVVAIILIIFAEQAISVLLAQQRQLFRFFSSDNLPRIYNKLLDDQTDNDNRFKYRKLWVRILAIVLILFDVLAIVFYWLSMNFG